MSEEQQEIASVFSVAVDREMCQTAAVCLAYHMYELDDDGIAIIRTKNGQSSNDLDNQMRDAEGYVRVDDMPNPDNISREELQKKLLESAKICPFNAIIVRDEAGEIIWPPQ